MSEMQLPDTKVFIVPKQEFASVFVEFSRRAKKTINSAYFLANATIYGDKYRVGRKILTSLVAAQSRFVQVNFLLGWPSELQSRTKNLVVAKFFNKHALNVKIHFDENFHHKFCIFDDNIVLIGSHNLTLGALTRNYEISVAVNDCTVANKMLLLHQRLMKEGIDFEKINWDSVLTEKANVTNKMKSSHQSI